MSDPGCDDFSESKEQWKGLGKQEDNKISGRFTKPNPTEETVYGRGYEVSPPPEKGKSALKEDGINRNVMDYNPNKRTTWNAGNGSVSTSEEDMHVNTGVATLPPPKEENSVPTRPNTIKDIQNDRRNKDDRTAKIDTRRTHGTEHPLTLGHAAIHNDRQNKEDKTANTDNPQTRRTEHPLSLGDADIGNNRQKENNRTENMGTYHTRRTEHPVSQRGDRGVVIDQRKGDIGIVNDQRKYDVRIARSDPPPPQTGYGQDQRTIE